MVKPNRQKQSVGLVLLAALVGLVGRVGMVGALRGAVHRAVPGARGLQGCEVRGRHPPATDVLA